MTSELPQDGSAYFSHSSGKYVELKGKDASYGRPPPGSRTEGRGIAAGDRISGEVIDLCRNIKHFGHFDNSIGMYTVTFGILFTAYTKISNKLVGMLLRARKHKLVDFEGEMLFQRRDDDVVIRLVRMPPES